MSADRPKPLAGVRVLDLTRLLPGPVATLHLADLGADVIKIEDTGVGDYARTIGPGRAGMSDFFRLVNRNKRSLRLDLKREKGRAVLLALARRADVLVEGFRPGVMARLGLDYSALAAANPRIVYCSISGYGQDGPYALRAGHDLVYLGLAGVLDQIGTPQAPVVPNFQIADLLGGALVPLLGILAALIEARASGRGRYVDAAMSDAVLAHAIFPLLGLRETGAAPTRGSTLLGGGYACYNVYRAGDGRFVAVGALEKKFWDSLCDALGCPELKPKHMVRGAEAETVKARLAAIFASRSRDEWVRELADRDCCVGAVLTIEEALDDEQFAARGMVVRDADGLPQFALPLKLSDFRFAIERAAPQPGEHTREILREAGYSDEDIVALEREGVV